MEDENESVSKTLEYAYDDWCIAQMGVFIDASSGNSRTTTHDGKSRSRSKNHAKVISTMSGRDITKTCLIRDRLYAAKEERQVYHTIRSK